jgi:hypothetical protein
MKAHQYLDGTRFCIVYMTVLDAATQEVELTTVHGRARVLPDRIAVEDRNGKAVSVPHSALGSIYRSDGTDLLKDAEFYVLVRVSDSFQG